MVAGTPSRMPAKELDHLAGCIGPTRISVGTGVAAAGPSMRCTVYQPQFEQFRVRGIDITGSRVGVTAGPLPLLDVLLQSETRAELLDDQLGILQVNRLVAIAVKNNGRHERYAACDLPTTTAGAHRRKGRGHVISGAGGEPGVNADRGVDVGISRAHDRRCGATGGQSGDVHP